MFDRARVVLVAAATLLAVSLLACQGPETPPAAAAPAVASTPAPTPAVPAPELLPPNIEMKVDAAYRGTLPCPDCEGLDTAYHFLSSPGQDGGIYIAVAVSKGRAGGDTRREWEGRWIMGRGYEPDPSATVYRTDPDDNFATRNFLVVNDEQIEMLDRLSRRIVSNHSYVLKRTASMP